jgi:hypothetical protein
MICCRPQNASNEVPRVHVPSIAPVPDSLDPEVARALLGLARSQPTPIDAGVRSTLTGPLPRRSWGQAISGQLPTDRAIDASDVKTAMDGSAHGAATPDVDQIAAVIGDQPDAQGIAHMFEEGVFYRTPEGGFDIDPVKALNLAGVKAPSPIPPGATSPATQSFDASMQTLAEPGAIEAMDNLEALDGSGTANNGGFGIGGMRRLAGMAPDDPAWTKVAPDVSPTDRRRYIAAAQVATDPANDAQLQSYSGGDHVFDAGELQQAASDFGPQAPEGPKAVFYDAARLLATDDGIKAMDNLEARQGSGKADNGRFGTWGMHLLAGESKDDKAFWNAIDPALTNPNDRQALIDAANTALDAQYAPYLEELSGGDGIFDAGEMRKPISDFDAHAISNDAIDPSRQGQEGDCWVLASIGAMAATPQGRQTVADAVYQNQDGSHTVTFPGDPDHPVLVTDADLNASRKARFSSGDQDVLILETACEKYAKANPAFNGGAGTTTKGGYPSIALTLLSGQQGTAISTGYDPVKTKAWLGIIGKQSPMPAVSFDSEVGADGNPGAIGNGRFHAFTVQQIDLANNTITFVNPWNSGKPVTMNIDDFAGKVTNIYTTVPPGP